MRVEFNSNGFKSEINASFNSSTVSQFDVFIEKYWSRQTLLSALSILLTLLSLGVALFAGLGIDILAEIFVFDGARLAIWVAVFSIALSTFGGTAGAISVILWAKGRKKDETEKSASAASIVMPIFSLVVFIASLTLNILFLIF